MKEQEKMVQEAYKLADKEQSIPESKELLVAWLDTMIENLHKASRQHRKWFRELNMGDLDKVEGEYNVTVSTCGLFEFNDTQLHIYQGLEILADALGITRLGKQDLGNGYIQYSFQYGDVTVCQLISPHYDKKSKTLMEYAEGGEHT